jgi:hypothetical protein
MEKMHENLGQHIGHTDDAYWAWNAEQNAPMLNALKTWRSKANAFLRVVSDHPLPHGATQPILYRLETDEAQRARPWDYIPEQDRKTLESLGWSQQALGAHLAEFWLASRASVDSPLHFQMHVGDTPHLFVLHSAAGDDLDAVNNPDYLLYFRIQGLSVAVAGMHRGGMNPFDLLPAAYRAALEAEGLDRDRFQSALRKLYLCRRRRIHTGCSPITFGIDGRLVAQLQRASKTIKKEMRRTKAKAG